MLIIIENIEVQQQNNAEVQDCVNVLSKLIFVSILLFVTKTQYACVRGSLVVPLVGNICTVGTNVIANGTIGREICANGKNGYTMGTYGTTVTNQWYNWEDPEHTLYFRNHTFKTLFKSF